MPTAELTALIATALAVVGALPQLRLLVRTGDPNGVSLASAALGVGSELGWVAYTLRECLWSAVPEAVMMTGTNALLAWALVRTGVALARPLAAAMIWGAAMMLGAALGGWAVLGAMLPIAYGVQVVPSIWSAYQSWAPSGIAIATWTLNLAECLLWGMYGAMRADPALTMLAAIGSSASLAIIVRVLMTRDRVRAVRRVALSMPRASWAPPGLHADPRA